MSNFLTKMLGSLRFLVSAFRFQDLATRRPDTRNLTPETFL